MRSTLSSVPSPNSSKPADAAEAAEAGDALRTLARGLRRAQGFALFFAVCNRPDERERWVAMLEQALPDLHLHRVRLAPDTTDVLGEVDRQVPDPKGPVLILNLEQAVPSSLPRHEVLDRLNLQRPEWSSRLPKPVVFWVPEYVLGYLEREAPDFFDWRSDTITFPKLGAEELEQFRVLTWEPSVRSSLPKSARLARIQELRDRLAETSASKDPAIRQARAGWLQELASHLVFTGQGVKESVGLYREAIGISEELGDRHLRAIFLGDLGQVLTRQGDYDRALGYLQQSLAIRDETADKQGEGRTLNNLADIFHARSDYEQALDFLQKALAIQRKISDKEGESATLISLSQVLHARGDYDQAIDILQQSLAIVREVGDKANEGAIFNNLALSFEARGEYDRGTEFLQKALAIQRDLGDKQGEGTTLANLAHIFETSGDYDRATEILQKALAIQLEIGDKKGEGTTLNNLATISQARSDYARALGFLQQCLAIQREIGDRRGEGTSLNNLSQIYDDRGDYDRALDFLQQSLSIRREIDDRAGLCPTLFNIGCIQARQGAMKEANASWVEAYRTAKKIGLARALQALDGLARKLGQPGLSYWERLADQTKAQSISPENDPVPKSLH